MATFGWGATQWGFVKWASATTVITATTMPNLTGLFMNPAANGGTAPLLQSGTLTGSTNPASIGTTYTVGGSSNVVYCALT